MDIYLKTFKMAGTMSLFLSPWYIVNDKDENIFWKIKYVYQCI